MPAHKQTKRRTRDVMHWNDVDAAQFVTYEDVTVINRAGKAQTKRVKVPLYPRESDSGQIPAACPPYNQADYVSHDVDMADEVPIADPKPRKVRSRMHLDTMNVINF